MDEPMATPLSAEYERRIAEAWQQGAQRTREADIALLERQADGWTKPNQMMAEQCVEAVLREAAEELRASALPERAESACQK